MAGNSLVNGSVFYHDPLTLFLAGLILCLLWGEGYEHLGIKQFLWGHGHAPTFQSSGWQGVVALIVALVALLVGHTDAVALFLAVMMVLLGGKTGSVFWPFWGVPALIIYGLFPSILGTVLILPVILWPGQGRDITPHQRCVGVLLALGLASHVVPSHPVIWIIGASSVMLALGVWGYIKGWGAVLSVVLTLRPLLLLGIVQAAQQEGLGETAQAAIRALLLDITLQVLGTMRPSWRLLSVPIPPLPGFLVAWLGMHAALGLATGAAGWTVMGVVIALSFAGLSLLEGVRLLPHLHEPRGQGWCVLSAFLLPSLVFVVGRTVLRQGGGDLHGVRQLIWFFPGGDGAVLAFPALWIMMVCVAGLVTRSVWMHEQRSLVLTRVISLSEQQSWGKWFVGKRPYVPWSWRRRLVVERMYRRWVLQHMQRFHAPLSEVGLTFWLLFLGGVLSIIGLTT